MLKDEKEYNKGLKFTTVKTTVGAIIEKDGKILLTKRNCYPEKGKWSLAGGHINIGETALEAIIREIKEETNLNLIKPKFFKYYDEFLVNYKIHSILLVFTGTATGKEKFNEEVQDMKWFTLDEIKNMKLAFYHKKIIMEYFKK